uniref:Uncharacterized protein n=1 Tax=Cannabis sativa TaxID=3483 RepID=A0A803NTF0_CANSA
MRMVTHPTLQVTDATLPGKVPWVPVGEPSVQRFLGGSGLTDGMATLAQWMSHSLAITNRKPETHEGGCAPGRGLMPKEGHMLPLHPHFKNVADFFRFNRPSSLSGH